MAIDPNVIMAGAGLSVRDARGNSWSIVNGQIAVNGVADPTTRGVMELALQNGQIWQRNYAGVWWSKSAPDDAWSPPDGTRINPVPPSADNTIILSEGHPITDALGNAWSIIKGKVAVNGVLDRATDRVIELVYRNGRVWQQNADHQWWSRKSRFARWVAHGDANPEGPVAKLWLGKTQDYNDPGNWSTWGVPRAGDNILLLSVQPRGVTIDMNNTALPAGLQIRTIDEGAAASFNIGGTASNGAFVQSQFGTLNINLAANASLVNAGEISARAGIGNAFLHIKLSAGSLFNNTGTISALPSTVGPAGGPPALTGQVTVDGPGQFINNGLITVESGRFTLVTLTPQPNNGRIIASGTGVIDIRFGDFGTTRQYVNAGLIAATGQSSITLAAPAALETRYGQLVNNAAIVADGGRVEIDAPLQQAASGRITVQNGGTLRLDNSSDGGTIEIKSGMLAFGGGSRVTYGPTAARAFHSDLIFSGSDGSLDFSAGQASVRQEFRALSANAAELLVYAADNRPLADITLVGRAYSADQFQSVGAVVTFADRSI